MSIKLDDVVLVSSTALAAVAAWRSASGARETATRDNLAFVWPAVSIRHDGPQPVVWVRLHNDGPGLAQDVVAARYEPPGDGEGDWIVYDRTPVIRAMRGGETLPPPAQTELSLGTHTAGDDVWSVAVRWTDTAGQRWELVAPQDPKELTRRPARLRRRRWQWWRDEVYW